MKYKRKKSRRHVRCELCTDNRNGNSCASLRKQDAINIEKYNEAVAH